jgi:hypothetical protein
MIVERESTGLDPQSGETQVADLQGWDPKASCEDEEAIIQYARKSPAQGIPIPHQWRFDECLFPESA